MHLAKVFCMSHIIKMKNFILLLLLFSVVAYNPEESLLYDSFPDDFIWGAATAAYQVFLFY